MILKEVLYFVAVLAYIVALMYQLAKVIRLVETKANRLETILDMVVLSVLIMHFSMLFPVARKLAEFQFYLLPSTWQVALIVSTGLAFVIVLVVLPLVKNQKRRVLQ
jgi:tellurite resistance protein TehA-like permease